MFWGHWIPTKLADACDRATAALRPFYRRNVSLQQVEAWHGACARLDACEGSWILCRILLLPGMHASLCIAVASTHKQMGLRTVRCPDHLFYRVRRVYL